MSSMKDDSSPKIEELGGAFLLGFYGPPHAPAHLRKSRVKFKQEQCDLIRSRNGICSVPTKATVARRGHMKSGHMVLHKQQHRQEANCLFYRVQIQAIKPHGVYDLIFVMLLFLCDSTTHSHRRIPCTCDSKIDFIFILFFLNVYTKKDLHFQFYHDSSRI